MSEPVLSIRDLSVVYRSKEQVVHAVDHVSLDVGEGQIVALVGESGSGKSTVALSIPLLLQPDGVLSSGEIRLRGRNLVDLDERELRTIRGREVAVIFQDPVAGLNPVITVEDQVAELLTNHLPIKKKEAKKQTVSLLERVGLADAERVAKAYPFQLSGGMCQRVMIAIATALDPVLLIADEPTSALDVMVQKQVLGTLGRVQRELGAAVVLIGHDMALMAHFVSRIGVMYRGELVEVGPVRQVFSAPEHPYTRMLIESLPSFDRVGAFRLAPPASAGGA